MSITVECRRCGKAYRVGDDKAGKKMKCKECDSIVPIPEVDVFLDDEIEELDDFLPPRRSTAAARAGTSKRKSRKVQYIGAARVALAGTAAVIGIVLSRPGSDDEDAGKQKNNSSAARLPQSSFVSKTTEIAIQSPSFLVSESAFRPVAYCKLRITKGNGEFVAANDGPPLWSPDFHAYGQPLREGRPMHVTPALPDPSQIAAKEFEPLVDAAERLERIGRAMHAYNNKWGGFPSSHQRGEGLSWRVHLLPMLGEESLFQKFKLDEPWDSPHNKPLLSEMPDVFKSDGVTGPGKTSMHVFVGQGTPFGAAPTNRANYEYHLKYNIVESKLDPTVRYKFSLQFFTDRTHRSPLFEETREVLGRELLGKNEFIWRFSREQAPVKGEPAQLRDIDFDTICAVAAGPETAAEWTRPGGLKIDPFEPKVNLGTLSASGLPVIYFTGYFAMLPRDLDMRVLVTMAQHHDLIEVKPPIGANVIYQSKSEQYQRHEKLAAHSQQWRQRFLDALKNVQDAGSARIAAAQIAQLTEELKQMANNPLPALSVLEQRILTFQMKSGFYMSNLRYDKEDARALLRSGNEPSLKAAMDRLKSAIEEIRNKKVPQVI